MDQSRRSSVTTGVVIGVLMLVMGIDSLMAQDVFRGAGFLCVAAASFLEVSSAGRPAGWRMASWALALVGLLLYGWGRFGPVA